MLAIDLVGGAAATAAFVDALAVVRIIPSLGGVETGVSIPARTSHRGLDAAARRERGLGDGLVRLSCGIEDGADLEEDLERGLAAAARVSAAGAAGASGAGAAR
jgi:cystathionine beta-lyase/cystathionine gamma-synthase